jgi:hypothetical protein
LEGAACAKGERLEKAVRQAASNGDLTMNIWELGYITHIIYIFKYMYMYIPITIQK